MAQFLNTALLFVALTFVASGFSFAQGGGSEKPLGSVETLKVSGTVETILTAEEAAETQCLGKAQDIKGKLSCLKNITFSESFKQGQYTAYEIQITQNIDHRNPKLGTFKQRLALLHLNETEPMVLQTSGYNIFGVRLTSLATVFGTNQLQIEHRYFSKSTPANADWSYLNIKQSADDFHVVTETFKKIYKNKWVNTGASKGGMTSVYHRYFYPKDVDGTVADVAPLSFSTSDSRYIDFVENVGGEDYKDCREKIKNLQIQLLKNRDKFVAQIKDKDPFTQLGGADIAFEHSVVEAPFYFWQYKNPDGAFGCSNIPADNNDVDSMFTFLQNVASIDSYTDKGISDFISYYYQAATQLGNPANAITHLMALLKFEFTIDQYTPKEATYTYSNKEMLKVDKWVRNKAEQVMFIYGAFDPWSAGEFPVSEKGKEVYKYFVPKGNHGVNFKSLPKAEYNAAVATLTKWLGKAPVVEPSSVANQDSGATTTGSALGQLNSVGSKTHDTLGAEGQLADELKTLEEIEFEARRKYRLKF